MSKFKGKERADRHAIYMYNKKFNSLSSMPSKINALASALEEAEEEIERLLKDAEEEIERLSQKN